MVTNDGFPTIPVFLPPRIAKSLDGILRQKLTIIEAGTGFGKTTLLSRWTEERRIHCMWYSVDQLGINSVESDLAELLARIGREVDCERLLLVFDNLQGISDEGEIMRVIASIISDWPGQIVLCTRQTPILPGLSRLWAGDKVLRLDEAVLAFKCEEISAVMMREYGIILSQEQVEWLLHETEGWPLAIHLAGRTTAASGGIWNPETVTKVWRERLFPYLQTEIMAELSPEKQAFLLTLAVPEDFSGEVFGPLLGLSVFRDNLEWSVRNHVFLINLTEDTWRFHRLFKDFLQSKLEKSPKLYQDLNLSVGRRYLSMGREEAAIPCLARADAYDEAGQVLEGLVPILLADNRLETVEWLLSILPGHGDRFMSNALLVFGEALANIGKGAEALPWLKRASLGFGQSGDDLGITRSLCAMGVVYAALGLKEEAEAVYRQAEREELADEKNRGVVISYIDHYLKMFTPLRVDVPKLNLKCLGSFQIYRGQEPLDHRSWRRRKALLVLKYLATHPAHKAFKEQLLDLFWPNDDPEKASNSYYVTIHSLRRELSAGLSEAVDYLEVERGAVALAPGLLAGVDVDEFSFMYQEGLRFWTVNTDQAAQCFSSAANLYRGNLLAEDPYEEWLFPLRDQLKSQYLACLTHLARYAAENEELESALELWNELILHDGTNELAAREAMGLLGRMGRWSEVLQCYRRLCDRLMAELDIMPENETQKLYRMLVREEKSRSL